MRLSRTCFEGISVVLRGYLRRALRQGWSYYLIINTLKKEVFMAFYKKSKQKVNGKWYPRSVTVGKPVTTDEVADRLARISTVSRGDTYAVLKELGGVLGDCMADGRTVKLDGVGTFYYTSAANGQGVDTPEEVSAKQITGVRVRFIPETSRNSNNQVVTRSLISDNIFWEEWGGNDKKTSGSTEDGGSEEEGGQSGNPL